MLYASRGDWPEEPALSAWLGEVGCAREVPEKLLTSGRFGDAVIDILSQPRPASVSPSGHKQAIVLLKALIGRKSRPASDG